MIYLLHGQDEFRIRQRLERISQDGNYDHLTSFSFYADQTPLSTIINELSTVSIFSKNKLISVYGLATNRNKREQELLSQALSEKDSTLTIVFGENTLLPSHNWLFKTVQKTGRIEAYPNLKPNEVRDWIKKEVFTKGGTIDYQTTDLLLNKLGRDLNLISNELEKLLLFDQKVTKESVNDLIGDDSYESIFALMDAISDKNKAKALSFIDFFLKSAGDEFVLLRMLHRQIKNLLIAKELSSQGVTASQISQELKTPAFITPKLIQQTENFSYLQLVKLFENILKIEVLLKSSTSNPNLLFSKLIYEATD